jgi:hypothetical protein
VETGPDLEAAAAVVEAVGVAARVAVDAGLLAGGEALAHRAVGIADLPLEVAALDGRRASGQREQPA